MLLAVALLAGAAPLGCAGESGLRGDSGADRGPRREGGGVAEGRPGLGDTRPVDGKRPPDLASSVCAAFQLEGTSCAGGAACPTGLVPAILDGKACTCHVPCDPTKGQTCSPTVCGRLCVQLSDQGKPLPGQGACLEDKGATAGEPCPPGCKLGLTCATLGATAAFCRHSCTGASDCPGYKMVCVPLTGTSSKVCLPGGSTTGPKDGESCADATAFCVQGLLCDPTSKTCARACSPTGPACTPQTCTRLVDSASGVVVGYGCR